MEPKTPLRVALYARFSSDLQRQTSITDQLVAARARALAEGWPVTIERADEGISGAVPFAMRAGGKALLADALAHRFDVLIVEGLDRAFRDLGEQEMIVKRIEHRGIRIIGTSDGYDTNARGRKVMRVARGLVNEIYLDDLRDKTHRGLAGQFSRGLSAGGRTFGYSTEAVPGGRAQIIDAEQAKIVVRVFEEYAAGSSTRAIVSRLNAEGILSARGGTWAVSALIGSSGQGLGLLRNELYIGRVWWNRRQWIKDPDTGTRRYVERPQAEWQLREAPELRIVSDELWQNARGRERSGPPRGTRIGKGAIPKTIFGGLLVCPTCGGAIVAVDARRYGCNVHKDRGPAACANRDGFPRERVDRQLLALVRDELLAPDALNEFKAAAKELLDAESHAARAGSGDWRKRLAEVESEIGRLVEAVAAAGLSAALLDRLRSAERERDALQAKLRDVDVSAGNAVLTIDQLTAAYRREMLKLQEALKDFADIDTTRKLIADLLGPVRLVKEGEAMYAELEEPADRMLLQVSGGVPLGMVARARNGYGRRVWL